MTSASLGPPEAGGPDTSGGVDVGGLGCALGISGSGAVDSAPGKELVRDHPSKDSEAGTPGGCASGKVTREAAPVPESTCVSADDITLVSATAACAGVILQLGQGSVSHVSGGMAVVFCWM